MGRHLQKPFARLGGKGLTSPVTTVLRSSLSGLVTTLLLMSFGPLALGDVASAASAFGGVLVIAVALVFGRRAGDRGVARS